MKIFPVTIVFAVLFAVCSIHSKVLDRIIAVIDDQIILESELNEMVYFTFQGMGQAVPVNTPEFNQMRERVLNSMIEDKLLLKEAEAESISVSAEEIRRQRDGQIESYIQKLGSKEALEEELRKSYGLTLPKLRKQLEDQIKEQSLKMQLAQKIRQKMNISREDVAKFYNTYKDSLPKEKESVLLAHIQKEIAPDASTVKTAEAKIKAIEDEAVRGIPFPELAKKYSEDPSAINGGDLGFFEKGFLDPAFEKAAFALSVGEISNPVRSSYGYHLVKFEERKDNSIRVRHILLLVRPNSADSNKSKSVCDSVATNALSDSLFMAFALASSDDKLTKDKGGLLGWIPMDKLGTEYKEAISGLGKGENSAPVLIGNSWHVFRVMDKLAERTLTMNDDYETLRSFTVNARLRDELSQRAERIRKIVHVDNRLASTGAKR